MGIKSTLSSPLDSSWNLEVEFYEGRQQVKLENPEKNPRSRGEKQKKNPLLTPSFNP